jgi:hypothetical protein
MTIDEKTEVTIPLKILVSAIAFVVAASWYVSTTQNRIGDLEQSLELLEQKVDTYQTAPGRNTMDVELLKKDSEHQQKEIDELRKGLK